jgi:DNA-binding NarL/FixJ family response regulator
MRRFRIAIVAPSAIIAEGIAAILQRSGEADVVLMGSTIEEVAPRLRSTSIDAVVVDIALLRNVELSGEFAEQTLVGVQTSLSDGETMRRLAHSVTLYASEEEIVRAVSQAVNSLTEPSPQESHELSERECDVLILVAKGYTNKEIASELNISPHTVISHRKNIVHKTGIRSVAGLTVYAVLNKLIDSEQL